VKRLDIKISFPKIENLCPQCFGSGKLKAMQNALVKSMNGSTINTVRYYDTSVKCPYCDGRGYILPNKF
jgi:DnaJ-class molecular chaperone